MTPPRVLCVMLANGRPEMVKRAIRSFQSQTYPEKRLLIFASGREEPQYINAGIYTEWAGDSMENLSIGRLRNLANGYAHPQYLNADIIAHWDSDDWSHPERLTEQVALLQESGAGAAGYNEMLFWDSTAGQFCGAWRYKSPNKQTILGTSLLYWRKTWERVPFDPQHEGEDTCWLLKLASAGIPTAATTSVTSTAPRMIAAIHGGNTTSRIVPGRREWRRAAEWDKYCQETMKHEATQPNPNTL